MVDSLLKVLAFNDEVKAVAMVATDAIAEAQRRDSTERTYETMLHLDGKVAQMLQADIQNTIYKLGKNIQEVERPSTFIEHNSHLENCLGVQKVEPEKIRQLFAQTSEYHFSIPAKTEEKSNLNVFFGEGRRDKRGFVKPRP